MVALRFLVALGALTSWAAAQDGDDDGETKSTSTSSRTTPTPTTSTTSGPATHTVLVGANDHRFDPDEITANVGDTVQFKFYPPGHRVVRAEFGFPCIPFEYANVHEKGFDSGMIEPQVINDPPTFEVKVNSSEPIFFYCAAPGSCINYKMIGVINANETQTLDEQLKVAETVGYQLAPGDPFPSEGPAPDDKDDSEDSDSGSSGLSAGAIAGIAIGSAAVLIIAGTLIYLCGRRGGFDKAYRKSALLPFAKANGAGGGGAGGGNGGTMPSPDMVEANYANANPKSPGQTTVASSFAGHDNGALLRNSVIAGPGGQPPYYAGYPPPPSVSPGPGYGYPAPGPQGLYDPHHISPHASPVPGHPATFTPPPAELPSEEPPVPARSPPPGYPSTQ
ncbi:hypothetical protein VTK26DRAFT_8672 [Humicola hyalothermophila]